MGKRIWKRGSVGVRHEKSALRKSAKRMANDLIGATRSGKFLLAYESYMQNKTPEQRRLVEEFLANEAPKTLEKLNNTHAKMTIIAAKLKAYNAKLWQYSEKFESGEIARMPTAELKRMRSVFAIVMQDAKAALKLSGSYPKNSPRRKKIIGIKKTAKDLAEKIRILDRLIAERGK